MPDSKHVKWAGSYGTEARKKSDAKGGQTEDYQPAANDADGWKQYRRWISKAPVPRGRRSAMDPSLLSWKAYRDWSDQVRRTWTKEENNDD